MADLEIKYQSISDLKPYENNSRTHSKEQIEQIVKSIKEFGFTNPILIDEHNEIIAGHGRLEAAKKMGMVLVPTITLAGLNVDQKRAYVIADNKLALNANWDLDELADQLKILQTNEFDLDLLGFELHELDEILNGWSTDIEVPDLKGDDSFSIRVIGPKIEKDDIYSLIQRTIEESGIEGIKIA